MRRSGSAAQTATRRSLEDEIAHLRDLDRKGLRARWRGVFRRQPPLHLPRHLLFAILAYRLQADAFGDLASDTVRLLKQIGSNGSTVDTARLASEFDRRRINLKPGTILTRAWNGQCHRVMVVDAGFVWNGKTYDSLSKIAFAITGCKDQAVTAAANKKVRCAIYTRVSTEAGLDQDFNSLDAQYDAAQAYIRSQAHAGWTLIRHRYDDGGFSGGSTDRPALQQLIADIKDHKINVVVVYKVDRLTRSLAGFAKLVELFDTHGVSLVSVTQQFNTTTSMGRLTLNVLLSFAQFEREVTAERIRDKIAASKRKGLWVGGTVPLGYQLKDGKLLIVEEEAKQVRSIFRRYLELGSVNRLVVDLRERNFRSKIRKMSDGRTRGGVPFTQGPLFYMLRNRFYVGEVRYKNAIYPGPQPPLMDRELFDAVQEKLTAQWSHRTTTRNSSPALLRGLLFDESGHPMRPTHATKNGVRYRYYVSQPYLRGITIPPPGAIVRVPAAEIESAVASALKAHLHSAPGPAGAENLADQDSIAASVSRIEIHKNELVVWCKPSQPIANLDLASVEINATPLLIPWCKPPFRRAREILLPASVSRTAVRPIKAERRASLLKSIARGRQWLDEIVSGAVQDVEQIAQRHNCSVRQVHMTISMAFIAPSLVQAAVEGRLPRGIGVASLRDAPAEWSLQFARLGLIEPSKSVLH